MCESEGECVRVGCVKFIICRRLFVPVIWFIEIKIVIECEV